MSRPFQELQRFLQELKRRNVYKVAVAYAAVAFVVVQAARLLVPALLLPDWIYRAVVLTALLGFPISLVIAWAFEVTSEGMRRTTGAEPEEPEAEGGSRIAYKALVGLGLVAAAGAGGWYLTGGSEAESEVTDRSIAVLPFDNLSGTEEAEPFVNGLHDDLLTRLSNISDLKVISRTSVLPYRETELSLPAIADSLGVTWIVEGGVQQAGDQVQVNAQLIQAQEDAHRWAETYRREMTTEDLFAIQSELTKTIAQSLQAELSSEEQARVEREPTENLEAYRLYVEGRAHLEQRTEAGMRRAVDYFRRALDRDSAYALSWSGLADAHTLLASYGYGPADSLLSPALDAARRALELQPELAEAHASLGLILQERQEGPASLRNLHRAVELKPSYARAHHWLGLIKLALGRMEDGLSSLRRAVELDPHSPPSHMALSFGYLLDDQSEHALESARRGRELSPGYPLAVTGEGIMLVEVGRVAAGLEALRRGLDMGRPEAKTHRLFRAWPVLAYVRAGDTARAQRYLAELEREGGSRFAQGFAHTALGQTDAAFADLEEARWTYINSAVLRYGSAFDSLRGLPRYGQLIRDLNRHWGLNPDGSLPEGVDGSFRSGAEE